MDRQIDESISNISLVDLKSEEVDLDEEDLQLRREGINHLWDALRKRDILRRQKAKLTWLKEGDANTKFFHRVLNFNKKRNIIPGIETPSGWVDDPPLVKQLVVDFFKDKFSTDLWKRPLLWPSSMKKL